MSTSPVIGLTNVWLEAIGTELLNKNVTFIQEQMVHETPPIFWGVFASDRLQMLPKKEVLKNVILIANLSPSYTPGSHFICMHCYDETCWYFDPLGLPLISHHVRTFVTGRYPQVYRILSSDKKVQAETSHSCGLFCLAFACSRMWMQYTLAARTARFLRHFYTGDNEKKLQGNDAKVRQYIVQCIRQMYKHT